ncbi:MAG: tRNA-dihydrouridine synthase family protein [Victivallales bacterium]|nr:tRNA-dihydrouridine synthase family protein [Victivallales bacterium]
MKREQGILPLKAGAVRLPCLLPGPMDGVTDGNWVQVLSRRRWIQAWWTPFLRISTGVPRSARFLSFMQPFLESGLPVIAQLMGEDTERLAAAAARFAEAGAAAVDLNCACPSKTVVSNHAGGWRLTQPRWIRDTIIAMKAAAPGIPISVKLRMGFAHSSEFLREIAPAIRDAAPDFVTLHFRTVAEGYAPVTDGLRRLAEARRALEGIVFVGSGDLFSVNDIRTMFRECAVDGVAPARGMLVNPRLLAEAAAAEQGSPLPEMNMDEKRKLLEEFSHNAPPGFILQMAGNLFGKHSTDFQQTLAGLKANGRLR